MIGPGAVDRRDHAGPAHTCVPVGDGYSQLAELLSLRDPEG